MRDLASHMRPTRTRTVPLRALFQELYEGNTKRAAWFRYGILIFDIATLAFLVASSFAEESAVVEVIETAIALIIFIEVVARFFVSRRGLYELVQPLTIADIAVVISLLAPLTGYEFGFLRALRALRLFRSYRIASRAKRDFPFIRRNYDRVIAGAHLFVFLFFTTALVYRAACASARSGGFASSQRKAALALVIEAAIGWATS